MEQLIEKGSSGTQRAGQQRCLRVWGGFSSSAPVDKWTSSCLDTIRWRQIQRQRQENKLFSFLCLSSCLDTIRWRQIQRQRQEKTFHLGWTQSIIGFFLDHGASLCTLNVLPSFCTVLLRQISELMQIHNKSLQDHISPNILYMDEVNATDTVALTARR